MKSVGWVSYGSSTHSSQSYTDVVKTFCALIVLACTQSTNNAKNIHLLDGWWRRTRRFFAALRGRSPGRNRMCHAKSAGLRREPQVVLGGGVKSISVLASCYHWNVSSGHQDDGARRVAHHTGFGEEDGWMVCGLRVQFNEVVVA